MKDYNTIIGVIQMRQNECSIPIIMSRYGIGSGTVQLILNRYAASGFTLEQLKAMEPGDVEEVFYPRDNFKKKDIPLPDFQYYYDRIHSKGSKVNISFCWLKYKSDIQMGMLNHNSMSSTVNSSRKLSVSQIQKWLSKEFPVKRCISTGLVTRRNFW